MEKDRMDLNHQNVEETETQKVEREEDEKWEELKRMK